MEKLYDITHCYFIDVKKGSIITSVDTNVQRTISISNVYISTSQVFDGGQNSGLLSEFAALLNHSPT